MAERAGQRVGTGGHRLGVLLGILAAAIMAPPAGVSAQAAEQVAAGVAARQAARDSVIPLASVVVTATRTARPVFITPAAVNVISRPEIRAAQPNTVTDLFRTAPGLDVAGIGVQQARPVIRGQRGQRILLMQDAMQLNNSRRQQEFGEIPGVIDIATVERVEVVRGPSSVLYGTDAIGGVVNIISRTPTEEGVRGEAGYRYGSAADMHRGAVGVLGRFGALDLQFNAAVREAGEYTAPAGTFGGIRLNSDATVFGTGVRDRSFTGRIGYALTPTHTVFLRTDIYEAENAGYGFVLPAAYDVTQAAVDIRYPDQSFRKLRMGYEAAGLNTLIADRLDFSSYVQQNERNVLFQLNQSPRPGASIGVTQFNYSDVTATGMRLEAKKLARPWLLLTWGADAFRDVSVSSDSSITRITGFGPPQVHVDRVPQVPDATYRSLGAFLQAEMAAGRTSLVVGSRVQGVGASTTETEGLTETFASKANRTVVGSASVIHSLSDRVSILGSVGRGFRSPNLIEWFFEGITTDGRYYQARNTDLEPETSVSVDAGVRFRNDWLNAEGFVFRNRIRDGIRTVPTEGRVNNRVVYRNVNIDELIFTGVEVSGEVQLPRALSLNGGYSRQDAENTLDARIPLGDIYSSKTTAAVRYGRLDGRFWAEYGVRHQGEQRDAQLVENPVGDAIPGFTVHQLRGGVTVFQRRPPRAAAGHHHGQSGQPAVHRDCERQLLPPGAGSSPGPELGSQLLMGRPPGAP
jgi:hemoglobin/transferrin/lactoferrin receptor protein